MSRESITPPSTSHKSFQPEVIHLFGVTNDLKLKGIYLKQNSVSFLHKNIVNSYITYELDTWSKDLNTEFILGNCLFGAVKLTKIANPDKQKYSGYGIRFD